MKIIGYNLKIGARETSIPIFYVNKKGEEKRFNIGKSTTC